MVETRVVRMGNQHLEECKAMMVFVKGSWSRHSALVAGSLAVAGSLLVGRAAAFQAVAEYYRAANKCLIPIVVEL